MDEMLQLKGLERIEPYSETYVYKGKEDIPVRYIGDRVIKDPCEIYLTERKVVKKGLWLTHHLHKMVLRLSILFKEG